jgi:hypothetical protein
MAQENGKKHHIWSEGFHHIPEIFCLKVTHSGGTAYVKACFLFAVFPDKIIIPLNLRNSGLKLPVPHFPAFLPGQGMFGMFFPAPD